MLGYTPPPWADTPWADTHQGDTPWADPRADTPLLSACWDTQCPVHAGIDMATAADGTHPTGMHSYDCIYMNLNKYFFQKNLSENKQRWIAPGKQTAYSW